MLRPAVLYVERSLPADGLVMNQIKSLRKHVDDHTLAVQVGGAPPIVDDRVTSVRCPFFPKVEAVKGSLFVRTARRAAHLIDAGAFDLIHAHFGYPDGLAACCVGAQYRLPYIVSVLGDDLLLYPHRNRYLKKSINKVIRNAAAIIGVSQHLLDTAVTMGADPNRCHHIPDGIDPEIFQPDHDGGRARPATVLFAGGFLPVKNVLRMIDAFAIVHRERPDVRFMLVGDGPLREAMQQRSADAGLTPAVEFVGHVTQPQLAGLMQQSSVLCLPSVSEGWPNVIVEALACGCPIVAGNVGGIPEMIVSDDYGYLIDPHDPHDIADKLVAALERQWDRQVLAARGETWLREDMMRRVVGVYNRVLGS